MGYVKWKGGKQIGGEGRESIKRLMSIDDAFVQEELSLGVKEMEVTVSFGLGGGSSRC